MTFKPASLAQLFRPPERCRGVFGWLIGYAADAGFLEDAVERFSGLTRAQRAHQGRISLGVMLDPGNPQIVPAEAPGVLHLPIKVAKLPFALLHAKVAVLFFQGDDRVVFRVIVSTGNWTRQTLEESLDLEWHVDVCWNGAGSQERTDLAAANDLLLWLQRFFDLRPLEHAEGVENESADAAAKFAAHIAQLGKRFRGYRPQIFDNRERSLFAQLPDLVRHHAKDTARNYLALGSGFFEGVGSTSDFVPERIVETLQENALATSSCEKDLFVNPLACQAVASRQSWIENRDWTIRAAHVPAFFGAESRTLHAKFIFGANSREGSNKCSSPWVYLGSGNLTNPGFMQAAGSFGNLEAGVVFDPGSLRWSSRSKKDDGQDVVTNLLPIDWDDTDTTSLPELQAGQAMPERDVAFVAAPIALLIWSEGRDGGELSAQGKVLGAFELVDPDGRPCKRRVDGIFQWPSARPRQVIVTWQAAGEIREASIPVIDSYGRYCAADLPALDLEEAWNQLANFPTPPADEELEGGNSTDEADGILPGASAPAIASYNFPVRRMMTLVEDIAAKQSTIPESDWAMWCNRLEQVLTQAKDSAVVAQFKSLSLDPLFPLFTPAFRPTFAASSLTGPGARYEAALTAAIRAWQLENCPKLGELR